MQIDAVESQRERPLLPAANAQGEEAKFDDATGQHVHLQLSIDGSDEPIEDQEPEVNVEMISESNLVINSDSEQPVVGNTSQALQSQLSPTQPQVPTNLESPVQLDDLAAGENNEDSARNS